MIKGVSNKIKMMDSDFTEYEGTLYPRNRQKLRGKPP